MDINIALTLPRDSINTKPVIYLEPGVLPYMGYIGMCGHKEYGLSAILGINRVSFLATLVMYSVWFLHSILELGMFFLAEAIDETINKSSQKNMFGPTVLVATVINRGSNYLLSGHK